MHQTRVQFSAQGALAVASLHDVVLVGGGGAGLRAAIAIAETNPKARAVKVEDMIDNSYLRDIEDVGFSKQLISVRN